MSGQAGVSASASPQWIDHPDTIRSRCGFLSRYRHTRCDWRPRRSAARWWRREQGSWCGMQPAIRGNRTTIAHCLPAVGWQANPRSRMVTTMPAYLFLIPRRRTSAHAVKVVAGGCRRSVALIGLCAASLLLSGQRAEAQTATQLVTFSVIRPARTAMLASATTFSAPSLPADGKSTRASVTGSSYAINTNESNQKIAASLDAPMPRGFSLAASLTPPAGAWSTGATPLGAAARDVVGGVSRANSDALSLEYTLTTPAHLPRSAPRAVVTFTITGGV